MPMTGQQEQFACLHMKAVVRVAVEVAANDSVTGFEVGGVEYSRREIESIA